MKNSFQRLKIKFIIIFSILGIITIAFSITLICFACWQSFAIKTLDWLALLFSGLASISTVFLGIIAYWQNERFKIMNDEFSDKREKENKKHQDQLLEINNRLIKIEENKERAYIAFNQNEVYVYNSDQQVSLIGKTYSSGIFDGDNSLRDSAIFIFQITNQTDVPIRYFQITNMVVTYTNYAALKGKQDKILMRYSTGGFIPSPIIGKGEVVNYVLLTSGLRNIAEELPDDEEINIAIDFEVASIFNRIVRQKFLLRLQRKNSFFDAKDNKNIFWNYCFESNSEIDFKQ